MPCQATKAPYKKICDSPLPTNLEIKYICVLSSIVLTLFEKEGKQNVLIKIFANLILDLFLNTGGHQQILVN